MSQYKSIEELLDAAKKANGHRISDFNVNNRSLTKDSKGSIGQIVEEGVFGYPINSRAEADFNDLGVELKVTGLKKLKNNDYVTKERLVLNIVNYKLIKMGYKSILSIINNNIDKDYEITSINY